LRENKPKLLIVGAFPPKDLRVFGGMVTACHALINSAISDYYELILIDSTQRSNPAPNIGIRILYSFKKFYRFLKHFLLERPDAIILFTALGASVVEKGAMAWIARIRRLPILMFARGAGLIQVAQSSCIQRFWIKIAMNGATHFLCQGPAWQRFATDVLGFSKSESPIVYNWTATQSLLSIGSKRPQVSLERKEAPKIIFLGWLEKEKGIFELLDSCLSLFNKYQFSMIIAGRGHVEEEAHAFVKANGLEDIVEFVGWVEGDAKERFLEMGDILVLPSWAEGFPNAVIEAMAAKLAVIVTTVGNIPDLLTDCDEALLIPPKDTKALESAIERLLLNQAFRGDLAERGYCFARDQFSVEKCVAKLIKAIDHAIGEIKNK